MFFKGRSIIYKDQGEILLLRLAQDLEDYGKGGTNAQTWRKKDDYVHCPKKK